MAGWLADVLVTVLDHLAADTAGFFAAGSAVGDESDEGGRVDGSGVFETLDRD